MQFTIIQPTDPQWMGVVDATPHDIYQRPEWAELDRIAGNGEPRAILVQQGDNHSVIPIIMRPITGNLWDAASPYGYPGITWQASRDGIVTQDLIANMTRFLRGIDCVSLFLRLHPTLNNSSVWPAEQAVIRGSTLVLSLEPTSDALWSNIRKGHRSDIKSSATSGLEVVEDSSVQAFAAFQQIYRQTMRRLGASEYYNFERTYFDSLRTQMRATVRLFLATHGGEVAGGAVFLEAPTTGIVQYHLSATADTHAALRPTKSIIYRAINDSKDRGFSFLHLGGGLGGAADSLYNFKKGFGASPVDYRTVQLVTNREAYDELSLNIAESEYFPAYRTPYGGLKN